MAKEIQEVWEELEEEVGGDNGNYVTRDELTSTIEEVVSRLMGGVKDMAEEVGEWIDVTDIDEETGSERRYSASDVERITEEKIRAAMEQLAQKKAARTPAKKSAPVSKPAPKREPEEAPMKATKPSLSQRLWGAASE